MKEITSAKGSPGKSGPGEASRADVPGYSPAEQILHLHRTAGNQAVQELFRSRTIQAKRKIGEPNDKYEQEADRVAEQVMRMPEESAVSFQRSAKETNLSR